MLLDFKPNKTHLPVVTKGATLADSPDGLTGSHCIEPVDPAGAPTGEPVHQQDGGVRRLAHLVQGRLGNNSYYLNYFAPKILDGAVLLKNSGWFEAHAPFTPFE